jgi:hypothetical protein
VAGQTGQPAGRAAKRYPRRRRRAFWALAALLALILALAAGGAYAIRPYIAHSAGIALPAPLATATARLAVPGTRPAPTATVTAPALVAVAPAQPQDAVQGFYQALDDALTSKDPSQFARAYSYLSDRARFELPYADFLRRYQPDSSIAWHWSPPTVAANHQTATIPVRLTEYHGSASPTVSDFVWSAVNTPAGWRLDSSSAAQAAAAPAPGRGKGKGRDKGD